MTPRYARGLDRRSPPEERGLIARHGWGTECADRHTFVEPHEGMAGYKPTLLSLSIPLTTAPALSPLAMARTMALPTTMASQWSRRSW
jgi:hypothetical protein